MPAVAVPSPPCNRFSWTTQRGVAFWKGFQHFPSAVFSLTPRRVPMSSPSRRVRRGPQSASAAQPPLRAASSRPGESAQDVFLLLLPYRTPKTVHEHPTVAAWRRRGWHVTSVEERLVEGQGTRLLITLHSAASPSADATLGEATGRNEGE